MKIKHWQNNKKATTIQPTKEWIEKRYPNVKVK